ncbi:MAG: 30S ribosomal protein S6 [Kiritimatiellia bacterium]
MNTYDSMFIFPASLKDDALENAVNEVQTEIGRFGGKMLNAKPLGKKIFARRLKKKEAGQYVRLRFQMPADNISSFRKRLGLNEKIFRTQILREDKSAGAGSGSKKGAEDGGSE